MTIFTLAQQIVEDANNNAVSGAKLYIYDAGTPTPRTVYQDEALTTAHPHPIVADSGGKLPLIYFPEGQYKYKLTDSNDVEIETVDNLDGKEATAAAVTFASNEAPFSTQNSSVTLTTSDLGKVIQGDSTTSNITYSLPSAVDAGNGKGYTFKQIGTANALIIRPVGTQTVGGYAALPITRGALTIYSDGANWRTTGDLENILPDNLNVVTKTLDTPPVSVSPGDWYIVKATGNDAWAGLDNHLVSPNGVGGWISKAPKKGMTVYLDDELKEAVYNGTEWKTQFQDDTSLAQDIDAFIVEHQETQGTAGGSITSNQWTQRPLNTVVVNDITGASLSSNVLTLPVGEWIIDSVFVNGAVGGSTVKMVVNSGAVTINGTSATEHQGLVNRISSGGGMVSMQIRIVVTSEAEIEFQNRVSTSVSNTGMGTAGNMATTTEIYGRVAVYDAEAIQGAKGDKGDQGEQGPAAGLEYTLDLSSTTDADPGAGNIRFNAAIASATEVYISDTDSNSNDMSAEILRWDDSTSTIRGQLRIKEKGSPANYALFNISGSSVDNSGYTALTVTYVSGNVGALLDTDSITIHFTPKGDKGDTGPTGPTGPTGLTGSPGLTAGLEYNFDSSTTMADPGSGDIRFNNATMSSVTSIAIDNLDANGVDVTSYIDSFDDSTTVGNKGILEIQEFGSPENFVKFQITDDVTDSTGYRTLTVSYRSGGGSFSDGDALGIIFAPTGDKGTDGAGSVSSGSNIGTGEGVFKQLNAGDMEFKTIKATNGASVTSDTDSLTINVSNASTTAAGVIEASIASEVDTGDATNLAVTPKSLADSNFGEQVVQLAPFDNSTDCATGDDALGNFFVVPSNMDGMNLVEVFASVGTAGTTGTMDVQIYNVTDSVDMLSTKLTIDSAEVDSSTAATAAVIDTSNDDVSTGDRLRIDVDAVHTTAAQGLVVVLTFRLP